MNRHKILIAVFLLGMAAIIGFFLQNQTKNNTPSEGKTPAELLAAEMKAKIERRKKGYHKSDKPDEFALYQQEIRTGVGESKPNYKQGYQMREYLKAIGRLAKARTEANDSIVWKERGPSNVGGRTRALLIDPENANVWIAGSASGGIWRTTNAGNLWTNISPNLPTLSVNALARARSNADILYAGTGEGYVNLGAVVGNGIFKSVNRGDTWQQLSSTANNEDFEYVNRLIIDPANPNIVLAATNTGVMRSTDGGLSWTKTLRPTNRCEQIIATPNNFNVQFATVNGGQIWKSTNAGLTWQSASDGITSGLRIEIGISSRNPNKIFASTEVSDTESALYFSENAGEFWQLVESPTKINFLGGQGWYDNCVAPTLADENSAMVGGVNTWRADIQSTQRNGSPTVLGVREINTNSFLDFVGVTNFQFFNSRLQMSSTNQALATSVEIRFGTNKKQKAHRFTVPTGATSGVPAAQYSYQNYVDVPFEAWDIANNRQLMVSFRDQRRNGVFELEVRNENDIAREYVYIHAIPYNAAEPSAEIAVAGGHEVKMIYNFWPMLASNATWTPNALPESILRINYGTPVIRSGNLTNITDAYNEFSKQNSFFDVHPDQHSISIQQLTNTTPRIIITNDGGISLSENGGTTFAHRDRGYNTVQCYGADKAPKLDRYIFGAQDNGCWTSPASGSADQESIYARATGGDGFEVLWHSQNGNLLMTTAQYNDIYTSRNGGANYLNNTINVSDKGSSEKAPFISRLANVPKAPDMVMAVGTSGVWRTLDFGLNWQLTSISDSRWRFRRSSATETPSSRPLNVKISQADPQIVWAGAAMTSFSRLFVSANGGTSFNAVENYAERPMGAFVNLATHPTEPNTAFAIFAIGGRPKILRTKDLGKTWTDITGFGASGSSSNNGFPDVAVYSVFVFPNNTQKIWAGTEIGIFESKDEGKTWAYYQSELPPVSVWQMKLVDNQIVVATHGRGVWTGEVPKNQVPLSADNTEIEPLNFYPNPAKDKIVLQLPLETKKYRVQISNLLGQVLSNEEITASGLTAVNVSALAQGTYIIRLQTGRQVLAAKLVVE
jgi:photosystem II stability/assembly factor-like uncharacterized protein